MFSLQDLMEYTRMVEQKTGLMLDPSFSAVPITQTGN